MSARGAREAEAFLNKTQTVVQSMTDSSGIDAWRAQSASRPPVKAKGFFRIFQRKQQEQEQQQSPQIYTGL